MKLKTFPLLTVSRGIIARAARAAQCRRWAIPGILRTGQQRAAGVTLPLDQVHLDPP